MASLLARRSELGWWDVGGAAFLPRFYHTSRGPKLWATIPTSTYLKYWAYCATVQEQNLSIVPCPRQCTHHPRRFIQTLLMVWYNTTMSDTNERIVKMLEALRADAKQQGTRLEAVQTDVTAMKGDVGNIPAIGQKLEQHGKLLTGLTASMATMLEEQQAQRSAIRSLHTEVHASREELTAEIRDARAEARADHMDLKASAMGKLKGHEQRLDTLEDDAGIPHPDKH
jgi:hypothetical protein